MTGIVPTEPELGVQRRCSRCREWWPADPEFFYHDTPDRLHSWCKACWAEYHRARRPVRPARVRKWPARGTDEYRVAHRNYMREWKARRAVA